MLLVDVIIPIFNGEKYISQAIDSVLAQTYPVAKVIVVDDGSTDATKEIVKSKKSSKTKIIYTYQKNHGLSSARNAGIKLAKSNYLAFLDCDDLWEKSKLEKQMTVFTTSPVKNLGLVYCDCQYISEAGVGLPKKSSFKKEIKGDVLQKLIESNYITGSGSAVVIRHACFEKVGLFDESLRVCEDWDMWLRIAREFGIDAVMEKLVKIRLLPRSLSSDKITMLKSAIIVSQKLVTKGELYHLPNDLRYYLMQSVLSRNYNFRDFPQNLRELLVKDKALLLRTVGGVVWDTYFTNRA